MSPDREGGNHPRRRKLPPASPERTPRGANQREPGPDGTERAPGVGGRRGAFLRHRARTSGIPWGDPPYPAPQPGPTLGDRGGAGRGERARGLGTPRALTAAEREVAAAEPPTGRTRRWKRLPAHRREGSSARRPLALLRQRQTPQSRPRERPDEREGRQQVSSLRLVTAIAKSC